MPTLSRKHIIIIGIVMVALLTSLAVSLGFIIGAMQRADEATTAGNYVYSNDSIANRTVSAATAAQTPRADEDRLLFLVEEEKLAHDVYTKLYEKYGIRVFSNIARSETMHQSRMLTLLTTRGIDDPRSSEVGVFKNTDLQKLYDTLIAQGYQSVTEAYKVGVAIEQRDIADIETDLKSVDTQQVDIVDSLNVLLRGSQSHLRAFSRQLG